MKPGDAYPDSNIIEGGQCRPVMDLCPPQMKLRYKNYYEGKEFAMDAEKLYQMLYDKMSAEQERFRHNLLGEKPEEILNHAYEYAMREDILIGMEELDLTEEQMNALLESPAPLADIYKDFRDADTNQMEVIRTCVEERAEALMEVQREKIRVIPLYPETLRYARERGEVDLWQASRKANEACRDAIEAAIRDGYDGSNFLPDTKDVLEKFGPERVGYVLAATLQMKAFDARFSADNQAWASSVPMIEPQEHRSSYIIESHSTLLEGFVSRMRKEMDAMREQTEKRPSIKAQLAEKPVPGAQHTTKPKDREER